MAFKDYIDKCFNLHYDTDDEHARFFKSTESSVKVCLDMVLNSYNLNPYRSNEEYIENIGYSYNDLFATCLFNILECILDTITHNMNNNQLKDYLAKIENYDTKYDYDIDGSRNRKRLTRLLNTYNDRETIHLKNLGYTNAPCSPRIMYCNLPYIFLQSKYPFFKKFLYTEETVIDKNFFKKMDEIIDDINNNYCGYERFILLYKMECDSKLRMFCECLAKVKELKSKYRLNDDAVKDMLYAISELHFLQLDKTHIQYFVDAETRIHLPYIPLTVSNGIVFGIEKMINSWYSFEKSKVIPQDPLDEFIKLNTILYLMQILLVDIIYENIPKSNNDSKRIFFESVIYSIESDDFFEEYLNKKTFKRFEEYEKQITLTHFKKLYKIKKEPPRKSK